MPQAQNLAMSSAHNSVDQRLDKVKRELVDKAQTVEFKSTDLGDLYREANVIRNHFLKYQRSGQWENAFYCGQLYINCCLKGKLHQQANNYNLKYAKQSKEVLDVLFGIEAELQECQENIKAHLAMLVANGAVFQDEDEQEPVAEEGKQEYHENVVEGRSEASGDAVQAADSARVDSEKGVQGSEKGVQGSEKGVQGPDNNATPSEQRTIPEPKPATGAKNTNPDGVVHPPSNGSLNAASPSGAVLGMPVPTGPTATTTVNNSRETRAHTVSSTGSSESKRSDDDVDMMAGPVAQLTQPPPANLAPTGTQVVDQPPVPPPKPSTMTASSSQVPHDAPPPPYSKVATADVPPPPPPGSQVPQNTQASVPPPPAYAEAAAGSTLNGPSSTAPPPPPRIKYAAPFKKGSTVRHVRRSDGLCRIGKVVGVHDDDSINGWYYTVEFPDGRSVQAEGQSLSKIKLAPPRPKRRTR